MDNCVLFFSVNVIFDNHWVALGVRRQDCTKRTTFKTKCSGQIPSLNFTSRTCSKNPINWYKPCRVLYLQALNVDEEEGRGRAPRAG